jgi:hypothetical protein
MNKQYFMAIIEIDSDKLDQTTGPALSKQIVDLKKTIDKYGTYDLYSVKDVKALARFRADLKRLNP